MFTQYPYYQPIQQMQPIQQAKQEIVKVNGENGARAYQIAPNSSVLLLDEQNPIVWLKSTDGAGYGTITAYSITPYETEHVADIKSLEERVKRLEDNYAKPDNSGTRKKATE